MPTSRRATTPLSQKTRKSHSHKEVSSPTHRFIKGHFYHIAAENPRISFDGKFVKYLGKTAIFEKMSTGFTTIEKEKKGDNRKKTIDTNASFRIITTEQAVEMKNIINVKNVARPFIVLTHPPNAEETYLEKMDFAY